MRKTYTDLLNKAKPGEELVYEDHLEKMYDLIRRYNQQGMMPEKSTESMLDNTDAENVFTTFEHEQIEIKEAITKEN